jgi:hypothetical protein
MKDLCNQRIAYTACMKNGMSIGDDRKPIALNRSYNYIMKYIYMNAVLVLFDNPGWMGN